MSAPIIITLPKNTMVPTFRNYTGVDGQSENISKGRKRRLDHLSWDEKLQRKKLKNRVAAQTSRDRKKAKMDEMDDTIKELHMKNELLVKECRKLREINRKLMNENADLQNKVTSFSGCCQWKKNTIGNYSESTSNHVGDNESCTDLSSISNILSELDTEVDLDKLEEFAQSLLQEITADMGTISTEREDWSNYLQEDYARKVVGTAPVQLEPSRHCSLKNNTPISKMKDPIRTEPPNIPQDRTAQQTSPQIQHSSIETPTNLLNSAETLFGTYDQDENCITIVVSDESGLPINEIVTEIDSTEIDENTNLKDFVTSYSVDDDECDYLKSTVTLSQNIHKAPSDCGYESLGSPHSVTSDYEMSELWNQNVTELFPTLM